MLDQYKPELNLPNNLHCRVV